LGRFAKRMSVVTVRRMETAMSHMGGGRGGGVRGGAGGDEMVVTARRE